MSSTPDSQYTVVRIKRKATDAPLSSLVINNERATKRRDLGSGRRGVFKLAETVPHTWRGDGVEGETLTSRIQGLLSSPHGTPVESPAVQPSVPSDTAPTTSVALPPQQALSSATVKASSALRARYRVVPKAPAQDPNYPPRVITNAELEAAKAALVFIDAQAVGPDEMSPELEDPRMAAFLPMLKEYLNLDSDGSKPPTPKNEEEYVYDLYYRDDRAAADEGADVGALLGYDDLSPPSTPPDSEPEDEADEDSNEEDYYRNDYPEDEDADEDMEGFHQAGSDGEWSNDEDDDDERGLWDYRD